MMKYIIAMALACISLHVYAAENVLTKEDYVSCYVVVYLHNIEKNLLDLEKDELRQMKKGDATTIYRMTHATEAIQSCDQMIYDKGLMNTNIMTAAIKQFGEMLQKGNVFDLESAPTTLERVSKFSQKGQILPPPMKNISESVVQEK